MTTDVQMLVLQMFPECVFCLHVKIWNHQCGQRNGLGSGAGPDQSKVKTGKHFVDLVDTIPTSNDDNKL